ncbi:MAG: type 4a pilus biogenesis protein PilO [Desulfobacterales bacterium]|jgi:type IV pilus assembly protein PilO
MKKISLSLDAFEPFIDKIEKLSKLYRILISAGTFLVFIGVAVFLFYMPKYETIANLEKELAKLNKELHTAKTNAKDLKKFQQKMKDAEEQFKIVMKSLPEKEEIPSLLTSISDSGKDSGLEFLLFQPKKEIPKEFYAEIPVAMKVTGKFHNIAIFFDRVARLSRVVNIRDISMKPAKGNLSLTTSCTAVTYKFIESKPAPKKKKSKRSKKKK